MKTTQKHSRAFTLIELLVSIAIIGILTGILVSNFASSRSKARDAKRISDLGQIQLALELFYDRCKEYPAMANGGPDLASICATNSSIKFSNYLSQLPSAPSVGSGYVYIVDDDGDPQDYFLQTTLENSNEVLNDSAPQPSWYKISDLCVKASKNYCLVPR